MEAPGVPLDEWLDLPEPAEAAAPLPKPPKKWVKREITREAFSLPFLPDYADQIGEVYPVEKLEPLEIEQDDWARIVEAMSRKGTYEDDMRLVWLFLQRMRDQNSRFPTNDPRIGYLMANPSAIYTAKSAVQSIAIMLREQEIDGIRDLLTAPPEASRLMGDAFYLYLQRLAERAPDFHLVDEQTILAGTHEIMILDAKDKQLRDFAAKHLKFPGEKGIDFVVKVGKDWLIGEAKYTTRDGGGQNHQVDNATWVAKQKYPDTPEGGKVYGYAVIDGVYLIPSPKIGQKTECKRRKKMRLTRTISALQFEKVIRHHLTDPTAAAEGMLPVEAPITA